MFPPALCASFEKGGKAGLRVVIAAVRPAAEIPHEEIPGCDELIYIKRNMFDDHASHSFSERITLGYSCIFTGSRDEITFSCKFAGTR